ncbi:uncharacterized protein LOC131327838 [Rhododendron vialii]|uniref:uncharacterized protein LOC131327838 n=1 Tax=Rhododendron vialii TaxID=182163 RepID=UPI00265FDDDC|nr:uncharacterized protein LOC131327838 [Rhododendron vialii]
MVLVQVVSFWDKFSPFYSDVKTTQANHFEGRHSTTESVFGYESGTHLECFKRKRTRNAWLEMDGGSSQEGREVTERERGQRMEAGGVLLLLYFNLTHWFLKLTGSCFYMKCGCMENRENKTLTSFCYWGGERKVNANGTFLYNGGMCVAVLLEEGSQLNELREKVCGALHINFEGKMFFYNTKRDKTKYVTLNDDNGVAMLFHLNEDDVDLFVEDLGQNNDPIHNTAYNSTSQVTNSCSQEMGLVPYLPDNANEILTGKGQLFESPDLFKQSVLLFAASNKFSFTYLDNSRAYYRLVCKVPGCPWKLTAKCEGSSDLVRVIMLRNEHLHNAEDASNYKLTFRSKQVGLLFKNRIVDKPEYLPRDICKDFEHVFQCRLNYSQGWRAKEKAKEAITGPPSMTFHLVPWMCRRLVEAIPNTRAIWTSTNEAKFKQLFVSYGCSIAAFRSAASGPHMDA